MKIVKPIIFKLLFPYLTEISFKLTRAPKKIILLFKDVPT